MKILALTMLMLAAQQNAVASEKVSTNKRYAPEKLIERLYFKVEGAQRAYFSKVRVDDASVHPKRDGVLGLGFGYQFLEYPMNLELNFYDHTLEAMHNNARLNADTNMYMMHVQAKLPFSESITEKKAFLERIVPYVTAGFGMADNRKNVFYPKEYNSQTNPVSIALPGRRAFVWDVGAGLRIRMMPPISLDLGWKYMSLGKISLPHSAYSVNNTTDVKGHQLSLGVIIHFWS